ncbi:hypothetical protein LJB92_03455 [Bacteroidales bacterium OttesenSCG-928-M06]|nr:hypothetical protein [Bacteroidales bacterium OttesenSCG-928-M06]
MIHYFNPGNETAILHASKYYQPAANQVKMQKELAFLPAWYASPSDFVLTTENLSSDFQKTIHFIKPIAQSLTEQSLIEKREILFGEDIDLWGIAPNSIYYFEKLNKIHQLGWNMPIWKDEYTILSSRLTSHKVLEELIATTDEIEPDILPSLFHNIPELEDFLLKKGKKQLLKSPFSSSGRGLVWLPPEKLAQSEKQIIHGMIKKQQTVSLENILNKQLDFSMHFNIREESVKFLGYSLFHTNKKGAYEYSILSSQEKQEQIIVSFINSKLLSKVKKALIQILKKTYTPYYSGNIGIDMLIYKSGDSYFLHPCVEINMRKSMGYLALKLKENYIHPLSQGTFHVDYSASALDSYTQHLEWKKLYPLEIKDGTIVSGYMNLCPVTPNTHYNAYIKCSIEK